jgi:serine/threonine protein kinase
MESGTGQRLASSAPNSTLPFATRSTLSARRPDTCSRLGPYEVLALIGSGGMGEVYRARDTHLGRDVAIKVLPPEFAADAERLKRFEQEARAVAALSYPNVLAVYDVGAHEAIPYLVTELLEGESLRDRLRAGGLTVRKAVETAVQIAQGLAAGELLQEEDRFGLKHRSHYCLESAAFAPGRQTRCNCV